VADRDVAAFDRRARGYDSGAIGQMHQRIGVRVTEFALAATPEPGRVLDVGCGTGALLRLLADRLPHAELLAGIDPAPGMIGTAAAACELDPRIQVGAGVAEELPFATGTFDLVVTVTSFDHWADQQRGLAECARVLRSGAPLVLCDLFSPILLPTMWLGHRGKARTQASATAILSAAGFRSVAWHPSWLIKTVVAI
jgi:ubiquinone/menaquinone biosynthesis C-methylase UbiE